MNVLQTKRWRRKIATMVFILGLAMLNTGTATAMGQDPTLDKSIMTTLKQCQQVSTSCAAQTDSATGILVFPNVIKADLIVGGSGGKGALIEDGKITGYYNIGSASAGLQAGVESASQVYVFRSEKALAQLKSGNDWKVGASSDVTVVDANANARAISGDVLAYVFDSKGLHGGISVDVFNIWKAGQPRPAGD